MTANHTDTTGDHDPPIVDPAIAVELILTAIRRIEQAGEKVCLLGDLLTTEQRHPIVNDLHAAKGSLRTIFARGLLSPATTGGA